MYPMLQFGSLVLLAQLRGLLVLMRSPGGSASAEQRHERHQARLAVLELAGCPGPLGPLGTPVAHLASHLLVARRVLLVELLARLGPGVARTDGAADQAAGGLDGAGHLAPLLHGWVDRLADRHQSLT